MRSPRTLRFTGASMLAVLLMVLLPAMVGVTGCGDSAGTASSVAGGAVTEPQVEAFVAKAADYVKAHGKVEALKVFSDPKGEFRQGAQYIFAEDFSGNELANGGQPEIVGQNLMNATDPKGVKILEVLIAAARQGSGWVSYTWNNPETGKEQAKRAYVIKVGDDWYVGSGMYVQ